MTSIPRLVLLLLILLSSLIHIAIADPPTLSDLEEDLLLSHTAHQQLVHSRLAAMPRSTLAHREVASRLQSLFHFLPAAQSTDLPLHLSHINEIRLLGYQFPAHRPGQNLPFGTPWEVRKHGPYPQPGWLGGHMAKRIERRFRSSCGMPSLHWAARKRSKRKRGEGWQEWGDWVGTEEEEEKKKQGYRPFRGLLAYTDDMELLQSAVNFHERRLEEGLEGLSRRIRLV